MRNGQMVATFEKELAAYCGARFAVSASNGTVTLQAALIALGVKAGDRVATTPLTHSATSIAILNVGAVPVYCDVDPLTWLMKEVGWSHPMGKGIDAILPVSLYGLHTDMRGTLVVDDAAQTLRKHSGAAFTSLSFQSSKVLSCGEGGALLTDSEALAERARSYLSLGYAMKADQARIDSHALKSPTFDRHHSYPCVNGRMNDLTAAEGLKQLERCRGLFSLTWGRQRCATLYRDVIKDCAWLVPQHVPQGWGHSWWTYAVACDTPERALWLADAVERHGGERPYPAWRITYHEPAFRHLVDDVADTWIGGRAVNVCPIAENLQPRLLQFQTNDLASAETNARALRLAIQEAA